MAGLRGGLEEHGFWFPFFSSLSPCSSSSLHPWVFLPCWKLNINIEQKSWSIDFQSVVLKYILDYIKDPMAPVWVGVSLLCHQYFINMIKLSWDIANIANISLPISYSDGGESGRSAFLHSVLEERHFQHAAVHRDPHRCRDQAKDNGDDNDGDFDKLAHAESILVWQHPSYHLS